MFLSTLRWLAKDRSGVAAVIFAVSLPLLLGALGLAVEGANWAQTKRSLQNAADEAAIAAANNGSSTYASEAKAVASKLGLIDGSGTVSILVSNNAACPAGGTKCYSVTISQKVPLLLSQVIGYAGNTTIGSTKAVQIVSTAVAAQLTIPRQYCVLALASSGASTGILLNGAPKADLSGCNIGSNAGMTCNGHNSGADYGDANGTNNGCGVVQTSNIALITDPYLSLGASIPSNTCTSYPQIPGKKGTPLPTSNQLSGSLVLAGTTFFCGDVQLTSDVTVTGTNRIIVIENGALDTNGYTFSTASGASVTVIFSGDNTSGYTRAPIGGGRLDIAAPTSGTWSGVALYQDPALTNGVDISAAGNSPSWNITGLAYFPHAAVTFSGAVGKATNGYSCFVLVADTIQINGTASILNRGQCPQAGLSPPQSLIPSRGGLVA